MNKHSGRSNLVRAGGAAAASAAVVNGLIYAVGRAADVGFTVATGTGDVKVGLPQVITTSVLAVLAGTAGALLVGPRRLRWLERAAVLFAVLSLGGPLSMGVGAGTKLALASMHVVAATSLVVWLRRSVAGTVSVPAREARQAAIA